MRVSLRWALAAALCIACGCRAVQVPREQFYRLELPSPAAGAGPRAAVLRVNDLQLGTSLSGDCLLVATGTRLMPRPLDRWIAPLDRLVTDALVLGLSRTRRFDVVKNAGDPGNEQLALHGRIVDFAETRTTEGVFARVALDLWLECSGKVVFHDEFTAVVPLSGAPSDAEFAVAGLSQALSQVQAQLLRRIDALGALPTVSAEAAATPGR